MEWTSWEKKTRVNVDTVMLVGLLGSSVDYEASDVSLLFAGLASKVGPRGISEALCCAELGARHGNLMG